MTTPPLNWQELLAAYAHGYFPMADNAGDKSIYWYHPEQRGVLPLDQFHVPRSLKRYLKDHPFEIRFDTAFRDVMRACADRETTWINDVILELYGELFDHGFAHSVECWREGRLVGGLYGVALGGAFFGESMFSRETNASKVALVELVGRLKAAGYALLDTQYVNEHLKQFGVLEIPKAEYLKQLQAALSLHPKPCF